MALSASGPFPAISGLFTPIFQQPDIPTIATELCGFFLQHKWDIELSHLTSGYWYNSALQGQVRVDETYHNAYGSSLFDYTNISTTGAINNRMFTVNPSAGSPPVYFEAYIDSPGFPLITSNFLQSANATFGGIVNKPFLGHVQTWNLLLADTISVIVYLDNGSIPIMQGYDFWGTDRRTKVVTRFWAHESANISSEVFVDFPPLIKNSEPSMTSMRSRC
ncbi:hypothetical protein LTR05_002046 [Lithohypha guttulata]|uniref:Uncharacterized protein n=1 Tax=Lithohypha guttulata TaxID=1690604 RepID=A0AAN7T1T4_9EURO|nr:hypothetical protein LTR05_002046 [Lithohypha guttulata]